MRRPVALVGAFERDNFGDLLFPWVTKRFLGDYEVRHLAAFNGTVNHLLGHQVRPASLVLPSGQFGGVWSVGGEVGTATGPVALSFVVENPTAHELKTAAQLEFPYLPRPTRYSATVGLPFVVNSVGLAFAAGLSRLDQTRLVGVLREADFVSVRDRRSGEFLKEHGVSHRMAPDVVAAIRHLHTAPARGGHIAVQASEDLLKGQPLTTVGDILAGALPPGPVVLVAAGVAPRHDSLVTLEAIASCLRSAGRDAKVSEDRDPLAIVDLLGSARLVLASSLHCRIVAAAYDVPRVSLEGAKTAGYAASWDAEWPYDVPLADIADATRVEGPLVGARLAAEARANIEVAAGSLRSGSITERVLRRVAALDAQNAAASEIADERASRVRLAEWGVVPMNVAVKGQLRRLFRKQRVADDFGTRL